MDDQDTWRVYGSVSNATDLIRGLADLIPVDAIVRFSGRKSDAECDAILSEFILTDPALIARVGYLEGGTIRDDMYRAASRLFTRLVSQVGDRLPDVLGQDIAVFHNGLPFMDCDGLFEGDVIYISSTALVADIRRFAESTGRQYSTWK